MSQHYARLIRPRTYALHPGTKNNILIRKGLNKTQN